MRYSGVSSFGESGCPGMGILPPVVLMLLVAARHALERLSKLAAADFGAFKAPTKPSLGALMLRLGPPICLASTTSFRFSRKLVELMPGAFELLSS